MCLLLVVTGCTSGIGQAYAIELAAGGCNVILISRSESKLTKFAATIGKSEAIIHHIPQRNDSSEGLFSKGRGDCLPQDINEDDDHVGIDDMISWFQPYPVKSVS